MSWDRRLTLIGVAIVALAHPIAYLSAGDSQAGLPSVEGFRLLTTRVCCSGEPVGREAFAQIAALGIKTVVSVDGKAPDSELAARVGLRYIHLPIGYDGVPLEVQDSLAHVLAGTTGLILVHCHHGKHRGPAAAAILAMMDTDARVSKEQALKILEAAGTGSEYQGLWDSVRGFDPQKLGDASLPLLPVAEVEPFVREMVHLDEAFDALQKIRTDGWIGESARSAVAVFAEGYREALRVCREREPAPAPEMVRLLEDASQRSSKFRELVHEGQGTNLSEHLTGLRQNCAECHKRYRN